MAAGGVGEGEFVWVDGLRCRRTVVLDPHVLRGDQFDDAGGVVGDFGAGVGAGLVEGDHLASSCAVDSAHRPIADHGSPSLAAVNCCQSSSAPQEHAFRAVSHAGQLAAWTVPILATMAPRLAVAGPANRTTISLTSPPRSCRRVPRSTRRGPRCVADPGTPRRGRTRGRVAGRTPAPPLTPAAAA